MSVSDLPLADAAALLDRGARLHFTYVPEPEPTLGFSEAPLPTARLLGLLRASGGKLVTGAVERGADGLVATATRPDAPGLEALLEEQLGPLAPGGVREAEDEDDEDDEEDEDAAPSEEPTSGEPDWNAFFAEEEREEPPPAAEDDDDWSDLFADAPADPVPAPLEAEARAEREAEARANREAEETAWALAVAKAAAAYPALDAAALGTGLRKVLSEADPGDTLHVLWAPGGPAGSALVLLRAPPTDVQIAGLVQALRGAPVPLGASLDVVVGTLAAPDGKLVLTLPDPEEPRVVASLRSTWGRSVPPLASCARVAPSAPGAAPGPDPAPLIALLKALDGEVRAHQLSSHATPFSTAALAELEAHAGALAAMRPVDAERVRAPLERATTSTDRLLRTVRQLRAAASSPARRAALEASEGAVTALAAALAAVGGAGARGAAPRG